MTERKTIKVLLIEDNPEYQDLILRYLKKGGVETITDVRSEVGDVPVIVLTGLDNENLAIEAVSKGQVSVRAGVISQEAVQVSVVDDGPGFGPEEAEKLFNKFEQLHRPVGGAGYKGTGFGLAICREIVQLHHGKIWAESVPGQGAAFHFVLPTCGGD